MLVTIRRGGVEQLWLRFLLFLYPLGLFGIIFSLYLILVSFLFYLSHLFFVLQQSSQSCLEVLDRAVKLLCQDLLMVVSDCHGHFFIKPSQDMMDLSLELFTGGLEDKILVAVPPSQLLVLPHFHLFLLPRSIDKLVQIGHNVGVKANHPKESILVRQSLRNNPLAFKEKK